MSSSTSHDSELWSLLMEGDEAAYSGLFRKYYPHLLNYGKSLTSFHNLVPDCVQEVFIEIWIYRKNLATPSSVKAYLLSGVRKRIARRLERDHIFRNKAELTEIEFCMNFTVLDNLISDEDTRNQVHLLNKLLNQLPARQKEALYLRYYQGLDITQIGDLMQINTQSASNLLHRGIKQLRSQWVGELPGLAILFSIIF